MGFTGTASVVTSRSNARVKQLRAAFAGQARLSGGLVAIEGENLLGEAIRSGMVLKTVFVSERRELPGLVPRSVEVLWLSDEVFASVVETQSPQGIAALLVPPVRSLDDVMVGKPLILVAAGLQDPGNLGTLVRSAEAFGASGVLATPGTVSAWNQKALRASAGSVFRIPVVAATVEELASLKARSVTLMAAVPEKSHRAIPACDADFDGATAILIGNEGAGLSEEILALADVFVTIPCPGRVESLNAAVAGSLLLYEASRQRASQVKDTAAR
jgi:TrmH family RNA methyltransferase